MTEQSTGRAQFGLDFDQVVRDAWRIFIDRPMTLLGVAALVVLVGIGVHILFLPVFLWLPFTICVPFAASQMRREERTDRIFLGWIRSYPKLLAIYLPAAFIYAILVPFMCPDSYLLDLEKNVHFALFIPVYVELVLAAILTLAGLVALRREVTATDAIFLLFSTRRRMLELFLLGNLAALFGLIGLFVCCLGVIATTTFSWLCLGVAYHQIFED
jgi:hypothetical protein